jgi:hypothetical protein
VNEKSAYYCVSTFIMGLFVNVISCFVMIIQGVSLLGYLGTAALSHRKPASSGTYCDSCHAQGAIKETPCVCI